VAITSDGAWLAVASYDTVKIWDTTTRQQRFELSGDRSSTSTMVIAPDGTWVATAGGYYGTVQIRDTTTGRQRTELTAHIGEVNAMAVTRDGTWLATAGADRTVRVWNVVTGSCCATTRVEKKVSVCIWDSRGRFLIVGGEAGLYRFDYRPPTS
jgi:WD40 repeat protein